MSQMLPEGGEVMRRAVGEVCPAPPAAAAAPAPALARAPPVSRSQENKELLRQQLLSSSKERAEKAEPPKQKHVRNRQKNRWKLKFHHQALPQEYLDHYEQSLQKANVKQPKREKREKPKSPPSFDIENFTSETFKIWAQRLSGVGDEATPAARGEGERQAQGSGDPGSRGDGDAASGTRIEERRRRNPAIAPSKIVTYDDLPYMGEMTLNNSKPRRGRKPKKADICHLIYENYGTVVPGQPRAGGDPPTPAPRTDLQNRIITSLLERKLSAESRRRGLSRPDGPRPAAPPTRAGPLHSDEEPLNLCVRDLRDLKIEIQRKFGDIYPSPSPPSPPERAATPPEQPNAISVIQRNTNPPPAPSPSPPGWSPAAVYVHPLALHTQLLYYQRLAAGGLAAPSPTSPPSPIAAADETKSKLVLKQLSELLDPRLAPSASPERGPERASPPRPTPGPAPPTKRKRSAIFVPTVTPRSAAAPPTAEVSICKFKFTGGSKPSLQEKKMLSVDSGGNLRYYSGTSPRGKSASSPREPPAAAPPPSVVCDDSSRRKRKSRKSLQREKLEQTFKEKGFLIQTQQLQSAEGATYCKFRQLRKFTRYLFRSWKDYLPGELEGENAAVRSGGEEGGG